MPLLFAQPGQIHTVQRIIGKDEARRHLEDLGFIIGAQVTVVSERQGNLILQIGQSRIALDRATAGRILVREGGYLQ